MRTIAVVAAAALTAPATASAGGIVVPGAGPQPQARAGAFAVKADDGTALAHNPAGFAKLDGTHVLVGSNWVNYDLSFTRFGRYEASGEPAPPDYEGQPFPTVELDANPSLGLGNYQLIPTIVVSTDFGMPDLPVRVAFGFFAPQGYPARTFANEVAIPGASDPAPGPQRYDIVSQEARTVLPSIAVAYRALPRLDVAARVSWGFATTKGAKVVWSVRNYEESVGSDSLFTLDADDNFVPAFGLGAIYRLSSSVELGANYNSGLSIRARGTGNSEVGGAGIEGLMTVPVDDQFARCETGGVVGALKACLDLDIPQMLTAGARYVWRDGGGRETGDIELNVRWENWSSAANTTITVDGDVDTNGGLLPLNPSVNRHGYQDVFSFRLGGHYQIPLGGARLHLRAGASYDTATAPDSWTRVDIDSKARAVLATGIAIETSRFRVDLGGGIGLEPTIEVDACLPPDGPSDEDGPGCNGPTQTPFADRDRPDPGQPLQGPRNQLESPFNAGRYESRYTLLSAGVTTWF